jgi:hypothetical protein
MRGLQKMVDWFLHRTESILEDVHFYLRLLFALYVVQLVIIFYCFLFLNTTRKANKEIENARSFVFAMPTHAISVSCRCTCAYSEGMLDRHLPVEGVACNMCVRMRTVHEYVCVCARLCVQAYHLFNL